MKYKKIIFVCKTNTSRSVLAAGIFRKYWDMTRYIAVQSRGLVVLFPEPANAKVVEIGKKKKIYLEGHMAKALEEKDFSDSTLILTMTENYKKRIYEDFPGAMNVYTIKEFVGESGDMDDPYGRELAGYEDFATELERVVIKVIEKLETDFGGIPR